MHALFTFRCNCVMSYICSTIDWMVFFLLFFLFCLFQSKARKKKLCIVIIVLVILAIIGLIIGLSVNKWGWHPAFDISVFFWYVFITSTVHYNFVCMLLEVNIFFLWISHMLVWCKIIFRLSGTILTFIIYDDGTLLTVYLKFFQ